MKSTALSSPLLMRVPAFDAYARFFHAPLIHRLLYHPSASSSFAGRYNVVTFVPVCLFQQFSRFANFWFLICCAASHALSLPLFIPPLQIVYDATCRYSANHQRNVVDQRAAAHCRAPQLCAHYQHAPRGNRRLRPIQERP